MGFVAGRGGRWKPFSPLARLVSSSRASSEISSEAAPTICGVFCTPSQGR